MLVRVLAVIWLVILGGALQLLSGMTRDGSAAAYHLIEPPPLTRLSPGLLGVMTLGYRYLYDDFASIWMLQILADRSLTKADADELTSTLLLVSRQHPRTEAFYMLSCFVLGLDLDRADACERITLDGLKAIPDGWRIPVTEGFLAAYRLNDPKKATLYYGLAASRPGAPAFLKKLTTNLEQKNGLTPEELQGTLDQVLGTEGAATFLKKRHQ